mmetsp:Transcript_67956/g.189827  ORF Transcript_67956/g.189827 Transcript_67956/m.189827 type:complete len:159 (-) Transcript_67956:18-494(-)
MALSNISKFNWEKILTKIDHPEVKHRLNLLRAKANEISGNSNKYLKTPAPVNFEAYKNKLKFTGAAVDSLKNAYDNKSLPQYHAALPAFQAKKREAMMAVAKNIVELAQADMKEVNEQLQQFEKIRISKETSVEEINDRFPHLAREVEQEINKHEWAK